MIPGVGTSPGSVFYSTLANPSSLPLAFLVSNVVWMSSQNCTCAVDLLRENETGEGVSHREGAE